MIDNIFFIGTEGIEGSLETLTIKSSEGTISGKSGNKENKPVCQEDEKEVPPQSSRKRNRPSRYLDDEYYTPTKLNHPSNNALHESTTFEVALDGTLEEIESPPEKIVKRRRGRPKAASSSEVETPQRVLRTRLGDTAKLGKNKF